MSLHRRAAGVAARMILEGGWEDRRDTPMARLVAIELHNYSIDLELGERRSHVWEFLNAEQAEA